MKKFSEWLRESSLYDYDGVKKTYGARTAEKFSHLKATHICVKDLEDKEEFDQYLFKGDIVNYDSEDQVITVLRGEKPGGQVYFAIEAPGENLDEYLRAIEGSDTKTIDTAMKYGV